MDTPLTVPDAVDAQDAPYDADFYAWTIRQAALLRAGKLAEADIEHIAEEIEDLGKANKTALSSQIRRILVHFMKLEASPATAPRAGWRGTVANARAEIEALLDDSPSLRRELGGLTAREIPRARRVAETELLEYGEPIGKLANLNYTADQVVGTWMPGEQR
jgi:hypothetical protein